MPSETVTDKGTPVVDKTAAPSAPNLPPAGHNRREEMARRLDALTREAEELATQIQAEGIDPSKLQIEREVARLFLEQGNVAVDGMLPDHIYCFVYRDPYNKVGGQHVYRSQMEGWEIVKGDMPEGRKTPGMAVTGERWAADCLLMRMPKDRHAIIQEYRDRKNREMRTGVSEPSSELLAAADRYGTRVSSGANIHESVRAAMRAAPQRRPVPGSRRAAY